MLSGDLALICLPARQWTRMVFTAPGKIFISKMIYKNHILKNAKIAEEVLAKAQKDESIDHAAKKVRVLCED
jgi:hypothetical protein